MIYISVLISRQEVGMTASSSLAQHSTPASPSPGILQQ